MGTDNNSAPGRRPARLSKQMIDAIIAYGDDRTETNFDRLKDLIVRYASRSKRGGEAATPKERGRKPRSRA